MIGGTSMTDIHCLQKAAAVELQSDPHRHVPDQVPT
jgi:hypothetical protein